MRVEVEVEIEEIGARGDGIARGPEGRRLFVPFTVPGDRVRVRLGAERGGGAAARVVATLGPGPGRADPVCRHFGTCGGCALQHMGVDLYREWKTERVRIALRRQGLSVDAVLPMVATAPAGRRRADFTAARRGTDIVLGFNARATRTVVDLEECAVLDPRIVALVAPLRAVLGFALGPRDKAEAVVNLTDSGLDVLLVTAASFGLRARERLAAFAEACDLARLSRRHPEARGAETIVERRPARLVFADVPVAAPPGAFQQASAVAETALVREVLAGVGSARRVADLFAGCGTFALSLARRGAAVHAVEGDDGHARALEVAARTSGLPVTVETRDLFRRPLEANFLRRFDAIVFDPPRAGARDQATEIARSGATRVVAVSCNPATFARDARILVDAGYDIVRILPVDQFLWSPHVELVATFVAGAG